MKKIINLLVGLEENNQRVDVFINKKESSLSRTRIKNLILNKKLKLIISSIIFNIIITIIIKKSID